MLSRQPCAAGLPILLNTYTRLSLETYRTVYACDVLDSVDATICVLDALLFASVRPQC